MEQVGPRPADLSPLGWEHAIAAIADSPGVVVVLGATDSGKTTWVACAARRLAHGGGLPLAVVDADIGQATVGPPATVALSVLRETLPQGFVLEALPCDALCFVGSVSPIGHLLQLLTSTQRLVERAKRSGCECVLVDTTGLVTPGMGFQLKLRKIQLLAPAHLVVLERNVELEPLLSVVSGQKGVRIHRLEISRSARRRTAVERSWYRARRFAAYFKGAKSLALSAAKTLILAPPARQYRLEVTDTPDLVSPDVVRTSELSGLLVGLNNAADETVGLGLLESVSDEAREIHVRTPLTDPSPVRILQLGSMRLDHSGQEQVLPR